MPTNIFQRSYFSTGHILSQEAPDSYACLHQSTANRTKSTNNVKCKKYTQIRCNFQQQRTAIAKIYLNWAIKGTISFTPTVEIRKNYEMITYRGQINLIMCATKTPVCAKTGQNQRVSNSVFSVSS